MGTDIFLYKSKADVDKDNPVSYLRANAWQERENALLRMVFTEKYWKEQVDERNYIIPQRYEFTEEGFETLVKLTKHLENSVIIGTEFQRYKNPIVEQMKNNPTNEFVEQPGLDNRVGLDFVENIIQFYRKGLKLEQKGKKPEVVIHW